AEDGIRDGHVTGVQTCALPIFEVPQALVDEELQRLVKGGAAGEAPAGAALQQAARHRVRLGLLIGELVARQALQPRPEQVRKARSEERRVGKEWRAWGWWERRA